MRNEETVGRRKENPGIWQAMCSEGDIPATWKLSRFILWAEGGMLANLLRGALQGSSCRLQSSGLSKYIHCLYLYSWKALSFLWAWPEESLAIPTGLSDWSLWHGYVNIHSTGLLKASSAPHTSLCGLCSTSEFQHTDTHTLMYTHIINTHAHSYTFTQSHIRSHIHNTHIHTDIQKYTHIYAHTDTHTYSDTHIIPYRRTRR